MSDELPDDAMLRRYFLGPMSEEARLQLNARLAGDPQPQLFEYLSAFEDELILDYLQDKLPEPERERFEDFYVPTFGEARVAAIRERLRCLPHPSARRHIPVLPLRNQGPNRRRSASWVLAAAAAAVFMAIAYGFLHSANSIQAPPNAEVPALLLLPSVRGDSQPQNTVTAPSTGSVRFRFLEPSGPGSGALTAELHKLDSPAPVLQAIVSMQATASGFEYLVTVPANELTPADYILNVVEAGAVGPEIVASRYFRVRRAAPAPPAINLVQ